MKIVSIADIHGNIEQWKGPEADILTISGDICPAWGGHGMVRQYYWLKNRFVPWCEMMIEDGLYKYIVFIAGNHDHEGVFSKFYETLHQHHIKLPPNIIYLQDKLVNIDGVNIYGTPWTPTFMNWNYMGSEEELDKKFSKIPEGVDILLSHGPAWGCGDVVLQNIDGGRIPKKLGSLSLLKHIKRSGAKRILHGHIHSGDHRIHHIENEHNGLSISRNVSLLDEKYAMAYDHCEFEIINEG
jgi:Icc-related predicted phosphoesterase